MPEFIVDRCVVFSTWGAWDSMEEFRRSGLSPALPGPGMLERVYQTCLLHELIQRGLEVAREVPVPITYKGVQLDCGFRLDLFVAQTVIVEVKSIEQLLPVHSVQVLLLNFNVTTLREGIKSFLGEGADRSR